jgi:hypothetical protein
MEGDLDVRRLEGNAMRDKRETVYMDISTMPYYPKCMYSDLTGVPRAIRSSECYPRWFPYAVSVMLA